MAKCPFCSKVVTLKKTNKESVEVVKEVKGILKKEIMYSCPHCDSVLGFGFFFGGLITGRPS